MQERDFMMEGYMFSNILTMLAFSSTLEEASAQLAQAKAQFDQARKMVDARIKELGRSSTTNITDLLRETNISARQSNESRGLWTASGDFIPQDKVLEYFRRMGGDIPGPRSAAATSTH
jgi:hypothetical protein